MLTIQYNFKKYIILKLLVFSIISIFMINNVAYGINSQDIASLRKPLEGSSGIGFPARFEDSATEISLLNNPSKIIEVLTEVPGVNDKLKALFMNLHEHRPLDIKQQKEILNQAKDINKMAVTYHKAKEGGKTSQKHEISSWQRFKNLFKFGKEDEEGVNIRYRKTPYYRDRNIWLMDLSLILSGAMYFSEVILKEHKLTIVHYAYSETLLQWLYNAWGVISTVMLAFGVVDGFIITVLFMVNKNKEETKNVEIIKILKILMDPSEEEVIGRDYPEYHPVFCGTKKIQERDISAKLNLLAASVNTHDSERIGEILEEIKEWEFAEPALIFNVAQRIEDIFKLSDSFEDNISDNKIKAANLVFDLISRALIAPVIKDYNAKKKEKGIWEGLETISTVLHPEVNRFFSFVAKNSPSEKLRLAAAGYLSQNSPLEYFAYQNMLEVALFGIDEKVRRLGVNYLIRDIGGSGDYSLVYSLYLLRGFLSNNIDSLSKGDTKEIDILIRSLDEVIAALKSQINLYEELAIGGIICRNNGFIDYFTERLSDPKWKGVNYSALNEQVRIFKGEQIGLSDWVNLINEHKIAFGKDANLILCGKFRYLLQKTISIFDNQDFRDILDGMLSGDEGKMLEGIKKIYLMHCNDTIDPLMKPIISAMLEWLFGGDDLYEDFDLKDNINTFLYPNAIKLADIVYNDILNNKKDKDDFLKQYDKIWENYMEYEKIKKGPDTLYAFLLLNGYDERLSTIQANIEILSQSSKEELNKWKEMTFPVFIELISIMLKKAHPDKPKDSPRIKEEDTEPLANILKELRDIRSKI